MDAYARKGRLHLPVRRLTAVALVPLVMLGATVTTASAAPAAEPARPKAAFGLDATTYRDVTGTASLAANVKTEGFSVRTSPSGQTAVVDSSMASDGAVSAASPHFVDLAWKTYSVKARYTVVRGDTVLAELPAGSTSFRDTTAVPGAKYQYRIVPQLVGNTAQARTFGLQVAVPAAKRGQSDLTAMRALAAARAEAAAAAATTTLTWQSFIEPKRLDAPVIGNKAVCTYGKGYTFGGDNHGFDWRSSSYRTVANALITWKSKKVEGYTDIGATHVYNKKTGKLVEKRTASGSDMKVRKLGSGSGYVDIRMVTHATNPFCKKELPNAIDGALQFKIRSNGNWEIRSGNHRKMPSHYIYIYNGGKVTDVYKAKAANAWCLAGSGLAGCQLADLTGYRGGYK
ncbi:hypothetical protein [Streptomyces sp. SHP 1-2]|uniref:hypothetical protein n=1 Tax=Streptomyces sp. SHP 1-2 TaxID=2769489 RepID=UPI002238F155|nr:hypothetical protein [Streptomyces sp. SHP 1-2]MCW5254702.1 hypothetical protein [Streptomyces sp. SHP 1-2]